MSKFTNKEIEYGRVELIGNTVWVYESQYQRRAIQAPCGTVADAYWQHGRVHVVMSSGMHYVYEGITEIASRW